MIYRNRFTGGKADAMKMWDAGEARFQVMRDHIEWGNGDYLVMALDINPPSLRVMKHEDFIAQYEEYPPIEPAHAHKVALAGITDDPAYVRMSAPSAQPPVINVHLHIEGGMGAESAIRDVIRGLKTAGAKV